MPGGQPTKYEKEFDEQAKKLCEFGFTDAQLAKFFNVTEQTVNNWKIANPSFFESLKRGKAEHDEAVEASLAMAAKGFTGPDGRYYPPNPTSAIFWLKNRRPVQWRDKQEHEHSGDVNVFINRKPKDG